MPLSVKKFKLDTEAVGYTPTDDEAVKLSYIKTRFTEMENARTAVDRNWDIYQAMIEAIFVEYPDERSSSVVPLASALIELYVAEATKLETKFNFRAETSEYNTQAKALEYVWKYDWRKRKRKKAFIENEYITAGFGTSILYTGFEQYNKTQLDPVVNDDLTFGWEKKSYVERKILVENVDIRRFYIDDTAKKGIEDASDCIYEEWISYEKFQNYKNNPVYKNIDKVDAVAYDNDYKSFINEEEAIKYGRYVKITKYWNVEKDIYVEIANGNVIIREHPMVSTIDGKKALPFVIRQLGKKNYSVYGRGLCEALMMFNSEVNNLRELLMDAIRRSNTQILALGNGLTFDGRTFSYDNEILTFDGQLGNNFQQISGNPPNQAIFNYMDRLYKDIAIYVGIDIQNIIGEPQQTAFQTEVQREASQKRINVWLTNRDLAYERFADLYKDLLQTYFPLKDANGLLPKIESEDEKLENGRFRKKKGKHLFEVSKELLRGDIYIDVYTNATAPTINVVDRQQKLDLMNTLGNIAQGYAVAKQSGLDIEKVIPLENTLRDMASDYNLNTKDLEDNNEVIEKKNELRNLLMNMKQRPQQDLEPKQQEQGQNI